MNINEKDFFYQATLRICGSLEIEQALWQSFEYLKDFIPLDEMWMGLRDKDAGALRAIAIADTRGVKTLDTIVPLPREVRDQLDRQDFASKKVMVINRMDALNLSNIMGYPDSSLMVLPLLPDGAVAGSLVMRVVGEDRYSEEHAELLAMLQDPFAVAMSNALRHEEVLRLKDLLADDNRYLTRELHHLAGNEIVGAERGLKNVMDMVQQVATRDNPVLLLGETGVGKEVIANAIHYSSPRKEGPFIKVNSGAIPEGLIDSELFGHEKGAFTGAVSQKRGRFERAQGGTIFLDEIGDLPMAAQIRLLRVVQQKELERVGGSRTIQVDVRIIAATHRNLEQMVGANKFREDLWYRLNVFPIIIPPLRQRRADIPELVAHFLRRKSRELNFRTVPPLAATAIDRLIDYPWRGNVRELENMVERALIQYSGGLLSLDHLIVPPQVEDAPLPSGTNTGLSTLNEAEAQHIQAAMKASRGRINGRGGAAEILGINPNTLRCRMKKLGIPYGRKGKQLF